MIDLAKEEADILKWHEEYGINCPKVMEYVDSLLARGEYDKLSQYLFEENIRKNYGKDPDIAYLEVCNLAYMNEKKEGIEHTIFRQADSASGLIEYWNTLKFLMWRVEFVDKSYMEDFMQYVYETNTSFVTLKVLTATSSFHPGEILSYIVEAVNNGE